jgi:predicted transcriptional regulator
MSKFGKLEVSFVGHGCGPKAGVGYCIANALQGAPMKSRTIPPLRVTPELRAAAESVLQEGESLSSFVEHSVRAQIRRRQMQQEFLDRGLASLAEAERTDTYFEADKVMAELDEMLARAEARAGK